MKKHLCFLSLLLSCNLYAQTTYYYGPNNQTLGSSTTVGNTTIYSGPTGVPIGSSSTYGNTTTYGKYHGETVGGVVQPPPPSYPTSEPSTPFPTPRGLGLPVPRGMLLE